MKQDSNLNNKWDEYYCHLSGSYIYFFDQELSVQSGYFYLKDINIVENYEKYQITLKSNYGMVTIKLQDDIQYTKWINCIY